MRSRNKASQPVNSDALLEKLLKARQHVRSAFHPVDLTEPPFYIFPARSVGRISGVDSELYENVRIFSLPLDLN